MVKAARLALLGLLTAVAGAVVCLRHLIAVMDDCDRFFEDTDAPGHPAPRPFPPVQYEKGWQVGE